MEINFSTEAFSVARPTKAAPKPAAQPDGENSASFQQSQALDAQLSQLPDVRPSEVERGRALVSLTQYPPIEMMRKIARLFTGTSDETTPPSQAQ